jgi:hypothetical protein
MTGVQAEIRNEHLPITCLERYCTNPLGQFCYLFLTNINNNLVTYILYRY